ncbi:DUF2292 domain-containing protein [Saccharophagus sp. K07]|jgi:hypothetical protein|uniref:DUF2292 domain-containing protein n=1 Tax=Saccharophagus sp. K07 TaxID=2283636 RepID=UPI00165298BB|nr:DUF2292 domain-containing protein [Saccharophagus sp. K07]MBC6906995.1 DUF2292 domain-containing protein [Saccharophagus sp. K07]
MTNRDINVLGGLEEVLEDIRGQLSQIQFGSLEISVHNGQVVQIERREKKRYERREQQKSLR